VRRRRNRSGETPNSSASFLDRDRLLGEPARLEDTPLSVVERGECSPSAFLRLSDSSSVTITITDRGPYVKGRCIDVTKAGAEAPSARTKDRGCLPQLMCCPENSILRRLSQVVDQIWEEYMKSQSKTVLASVFAIIVATAVSAQQPQPTAPPTTSYGTPIGLEAAKKVMAAAEAEAVKNNWGMAIAILDSTGHIVMLHKLDNTQYGSIAVAEDKARSAIYYRRPTKVFEDLVAQGGIGLRTLALRGASPLEGGVPIIADGKIIGAIGVSGATAVQDGQVAKAGADAVK
jgi:glc operon protein GlcG